MGPYDTMAVLNQLIVDDGLSSRGNRNNLFDTKFKYIGIHTGDHSKYGNITVLCFAKKLTWNLEKIQLITNKEKEFQRPRPDAVAVNNNPEEEPGVN